MPDDEEQMTLEEFEVWANSGPAPPRFVLNTDRSEDWIKTLHWDLPSDLESLRRIMAPLPLSHLLALPVAQAMPAIVRAAIEASIQAGTDS